MSAEQVGKPVQVPNTNGAFFSGAAEREYAGVVAASSEEVLPILNILGPAALYVFKAILVAANNNNDAGVTEYNGYAATDEDSNILTASMGTPLTGGEPLASAAVQFQFDTGTLEITVQNDDEGADLVYRLYLTWSSFAFANLAPLPD